MIRFENVHKTYKSGVEALRGISFEIDEGEFVFIIGKSGSGKSTLMKCITCEEQPTEGVVSIDGFNISSMPRALVPVLRRQIGMIYQDFRLIETKTVFENIAFAGEIVGVPRKSLNQTVQLVLNVVGLKDKATAYPQELSGGEQQRVAIARAMINNPRIIVADEPTGNLDPETSENIMALLQEINKSGSTVIVCTHDSNLVDRMKKRVIEISAGLIERDQEDSRYKSDAPETSVAPTESMGFSFGDDPAFEDDKDYHAGYEEVPTNSVSDFYFGETPDLPKTTANTKTIPVSDSSTSDSVLKDVDSLEEETLPEDLIEEEVISEVSTEVTDTSANEAKEESAVKEENWIEEIQLDDIDLDIQEDDD